MLEATIQMPAWWVMMPPTHAAPDAVDSISAAVIPPFSGVPWSITAGGIPGFNFAVCYGDLIVPITQSTGLFFDVPGRAHERSRP